MVCQCMVIEHAQTEMQRSLNVKENLTVVDHGQPCSRLPCMVSHFAGCLFAGCSWIEACTGETLPPTTELEESLRNGVFLAKLGHFMSPEQVPLKKIYDRDQARYQVHVNVVYIQLSKEQACSGQPER